VTFHRILAAASFLIVLTPGSAQKLLTNRTFGGSGSDSPAAIAADAQGDIYVAGTTTSADLPASHGFQSRPAVLPLSISTDGGAAFTGVTIPDVSEIDALATTMDGSVVYADTSSGLFRSSNSGVSWSAANPGIPVSAEVLTISPADSKVVYAGAKSGFYRSTDGGNNWTLIPSPMSQYQSAIFFRILADPLQPSTVWVVATNVPNFNGIYVSNDGGSTFAPVTLPPPTSGAFGPYSAATSLALDPTHDGTVYAAGQNIPLFKSTDSGATWTVLAQIFGSVTIDPLNGSVLYSLTGFGLQKSTDGGQTFIRIASQLMDLNTFAVDPSNSSRLYAASMQALYASADGGVTWTTTSIHAVSQIAAAAGRILVSASIPPQVYVAKFSAGLSQLLWATYLGGTGFHTVAGLALDESGNAYVIGTTNAPDFPVTAGVLQNTGSAFVSKISSDGTQLLASTFFGSSSYPTTVAVDRSGAVYVTGSGNPPPVSAQAFQTAPPGPCPRATDSITTFPLVSGGGFVSKFSADFSKVIYSTYLTGSCGTYILGIHVDDSGVATVVGGTYSLDFPVTADAMVGAAPGTDESGFLTQISADGGSLIYSTYLGGGRANEAHAFLTDSAGNWVVTGGGSPTPTPGSAHAGPSSFCPTTVIIFIGPPIPQPPTGGEDAFVTVFNAHSTSPIFTATVGGSCQDEGDSIALDGAGNIWIAGRTQSTDLSTRSMVGGLGAGAGGFLAAFTPAGDALLSNGYVGQVPRLVSAGGRVVGSAATYSTLLPSLAYKYTTALAGFDAVTAPEVQLDTLSAYSGNGSPYAVAPGQVVLLDGRGFGPDATQGGSVKNGSVTNSIAGVQVTFDGIPAPLLTLQDQSVALVVPFEVQPYSSLVEVTRNGEPVSNPVRLPVNSISPDVLLVVNADGTVNSAQHPALVGSTIAMFVTGMGTQNPPAPDGSVVTVASASPPVPVGPHISIGTVQVQPSYVGAAVGLVSGIVQVNLPVPDVDGPGGLVAVQATQFNAQVYVSH
jgi:uncharacterized protein (TIGR03437 family)